MSFISIILSLIILVVFIYKKNNIIVTSLLAGAIVILFNKIPMIDGLTNWAYGFADYIEKNFLLFAFSALFGKFMEDTGAAHSFSKLIYKILGEKLAPYGCILATSLLGYAGVSSFVIVYTVFPIFLNVWKEADLPRRLIPGAIFASVASYSAGFFPGSASTINMMTINYLGTEPYAEPVIGIISGMVVLVLVLLYFHKEFKSAKENNEHFIASESDKEAILSEDKIKNPWLTLIPLLVLILSLNMFNIHRYYAMLLGSLMCWILFRKNIVDIKTTISKGVTNSINPIINTAAVTAFGVVVQGTQGFDMAVNALMDLPFNPIISYAITISLIAGLSGSSTGASGITLSTLAPKYMALGIPASAIHRVSTTSALSLDSLPHNGLVVTMLTYCGVSHKDGYKPIFVTTVLINAIGAIIATILTSLKYPM